jgi:hypothetical protein
MSLSLSSNSRSATGDLGEAGKLPAEVFRGAFRGPLSESTHVGDVGSEDSLEVGLGRCRRLRRCRDCPRALSCEDMRSGCGSIH